MRLAGPTLILAVATCGAFLLGCGGDDNGPPIDGSTEGSAPDSSVVEAGIDAVGADGPADSPPPDAPSAETAPEDAAVDGGGTSALDAPGQGGPDATLGTVVFAVDASFQSTTVGGECAGASSLAVVPDETAVGHTVTLTASGLDPNDVSTDVTLTWSAAGDAGTLANTTGPANTFTCASAGTESVTVTAAIADGGASCPQSGTLTLSIKCDAP